MSELLTAKQILVSLKEAKAKKKEDRLSPEDYAKEKFEKVKGKSEREIATMGGNIAADRTRAMMKGDKKRIKYFWDVLKEFDKLHKPVSSKKEKKNV